MNQQRPTLRPIRRRQLKRLLIVSAVAFAAFVLYGLLQRNREYTIFSIPEHTTPSELEQRGFVIGRTHFVESPPSCRLFLGTCQVTIDFREGDTTVIGRQSVHIDAAMFRELTGLKPANYSRVEVDGVFYRITHEEHDLSMRRLDLKER